MLLGSSLVLLALAPPGPPPLERPAAIHFVVDGSLTMAERAGAESRFQVVRAAIASALAGIAPAPRVAVRVFGTLASPDPCSDSKLLSPFEALPAAALAKLNAVEPAGSSPLAYAVSEAIWDASAAQGPAQVVVITDGGDTCGVDVCGRAAVLLAGRPQVELHLLGFGIPQGEAAPLAAAGCPISVAETPAALSSLLESIVSRATGLTRLSVGAVREGRPLELGAVVLDEASGKAVAAAQGMAPLSFRLRPGSYSIRVTTTDGAERPENWLRHLELRPGQPVLATLNLSPGLLRLQVRSAVPGFSESEIQIFGLNHQTVVATGGGPTQTFRLPPGRYSVVVSQKGSNSARPWEIYLPGVEVRPQVLSDYAVQFESGLLRVRLIPGGISPPFARVQVFRAGTRELAAGDAGSRLMEFLLPAGRYDVRVDTDHAVRLIREVEIRSGERTEQRISLE